MISSTYFFDTMKYPSSSDRSTLCELEPLERSLLLPSTDSVLVVVVTEVAVHSAEAVVVVEVEPKDELLSLLLLLLLLLLVVVVAVIVSTMNLCILR
jgi:hypothetical protein